MTKIEERAKEWAETHFNEELKGAAFISYDMAATDTDYKCYYECPNIEQPED